MSISLIVFRLEVADDAKYTPQLLYNAPGFRLLSEKKSYAEAVESTTSVSKGKLHAIRGRRELTALTIETFHTEEMLMDDDTVGPSAVQSHREEPCDPAAAGVCTSRPGSTEPTELGVASLSSSPRSPASIDRDSLSPIRTDEEASAGSHAVGSVSKRCSRAAKPKEKVTIAPISMEGVEGEGGVLAGSRAGSAKGKCKSPTSHIVHFFSGNPAVENTEGIIHLYKHNEVVSLTDEVPRSAMVCMLSVPAAMTSPDLLRFVAPVEPWLEHLKIIKDGTLNQYMVLIKFKEQKYADDFYKSFNNIPYNSIESDICHLAYVARVETLKASEGAALPVAGLTELPVCPVCLERMDESVDGILTILCNHSFHGSCLAQWGDTTCPVCRYVQTPEVVADNHCVHCDASENLWICLICGHVGCGRYAGGHAHSHFLDTNHTFAMQLENNRVWDYAGDNYVHRLVQSKGDGKMVEVDEGGHPVREEKLDSITLEYTYLLTSQLEAQRHHFEDKIARIEKGAQSRVDELEAMYKKALENCTKLEHQLSASQKEKQTVDRKFTQLNTKLTKLNGELMDEREMNKHLRQNQSQWQTKLSDMEKQMVTKDKEMKEMQDQLRDVMFYLEAQQKLANTNVASQEEIQEGQIVVQSAASGGATGKHGRKKGR